LFREIDQNLDILRLGVRHAGSCGHNETAILASCVDEVPAVLLDVIRGTLAEDVQGYVVRDAGDLTYGKRRVEDLVNYSTYILVS
jgi:hypothetical protein